MYLGMQVQTVLDAQGRIANVTVYQQKEVANIQPNPIEEAAASKRRVIKLRYPAMGGDSLEFLGFPDA